MDLSINVLNRRITLFSLKMQNSLYLDVGYNIYRQFKVTFTRHNLSRMGAPRFSYSVRDPVSLCETCSTPTYLAAFLYGRGIFCRWPRPCSLTSCRNNTLKEMLLC